MSSFEELTSIEELFHANELFQDLTPEEVREVVEFVEAIGLRPGETLFEQGDRAEALFVIEEGSMAVRATSSIGEEIELATLQPGTVVGEMSLIAGGTRSASVSAIDDVRLMRLSRRDFDALCDRKRPAAYKIMLRLARTLGDRRREADARVEQVFADPSEHLEEFENQVHQMLGHIRRA